MSSKKKKQQVKSKIVAAPVEENASQKKLKLWLAAIVMIIAVVQYAQTISFQYAMDDYSAIKDNTVTKQGISAIPLIFKTSYRFGYPIQGDNLYRPLTKSIFAAFWQWWPNNPMPGHLLNVLLYALTGFALFNLLSKFFSKNIYIAFIASILFIAHPIHTEVVANIKSVDEILSLLLFITSLKLLFSYIEEKKFTWLFLSLVCFFTSLLSKESSITFLAVYPLTIFFFSKLSNSKNFQLSALFLIPTFLFLLIHYKVVGHAPPPNPADNSLMLTNNLLLRKTSAVFILGLYLKLLIFPHPLSFDYSFNQIPLASITDWRFLLSAAVYTSLFLYVILSWKQKNPIAYGILFFLITISVSSNLFVTIGTNMAERLLYTPSLGFCTAIAVIADRFIQKKDSANIESLKNFFFTRPVLVSVVFLILFLFSLKVWLRNPVWKNNLTLYESGVLTSPGSYRTHAYLGGYLTKKKNLEVFDEASRMDSAQRGITELRNAISIYPKFGDAWLQIGNYYNDVLQYDSAEFYFAKGIEAAPYLATAYNNLGTIYFNHGQWDKSIQMFRKAIQLDPNYQTAYRNLGSSYGTIGQNQEAIHNFQIALKLDPNDAGAAYFLGATYKTMGDINNSKVYLDKAAQLDPKYKK